MKKRERLFIIFIKNMDDFKIENILINYSLFKKC